MSSVTRIRNRCSVKGCPKPYDEDWHHCCAAGEPWHVCTQQNSHQHAVKRSAGGKEIHAILCVTLHDAIDHRYPHVGRDGIKRFLENHVEDRVGEQWYVITNRADGEVLLERFVRMIGER